MTAKMTYEAPKLIKHQRLQKVTLATTPPPLNFPNALPGQ